jgi:Flp pilus assembly protein TadB
MIKVILIVVFALLVWLIMSSYMIINGAKIFVIIGVCLAVGLLVGRLAGRRNRD